LLPYLYISCGVGITDFSLLKPIDAFRYGVCNYKYRTYQVGRRCYFIDSDVANMFPYKLPTSKVPSLSVFFLSPCLLERTCANVAFSRDVVRVSMLD